MSTTTTHPTSAELDALLEAARAATAGPWLITHDDRTFGDPEFIVWGPRGPGYGTICRTWRQGIAATEDERREAAANAALIAATNPATITRLVLMVRELQQENEQQRLPIRAQATTETIVKQSVEHFRARAVRAIEALEIDTTHDHFYLTGYYRARGDARYRIKSLPLVETEEE